MSNRHVGRVSQPSALDAHPISPGTPSTHEQHTNDHPTCQYDTLGGFLVPPPLDDDPPTTQRVISTRWVGFSTLCHRRPPPSALEPHPHTTNAQNVHPTCQYDTLGGFLVPLHYHLDPQRVHSTRWVGFLNSLPSTLTHSALEPLPPTTNAQTTTQRVNTTRWVSFLSR